MESFFKDDYVYILGEIKRLEELVNYDDWNFLKNYLGLEYCYVVRFFGMMY